MSHDRSWDYTLDITTGHSYKLLKQSLAVKKETMSLVTPTKFLKQFSLNQAAVLPLRKQFISYQRICADLSPLAPAVVIESSKTFPQKTINKEKGYFACESAFSAGLQHCQEMEQSEDTTPNINPLVGQHGLPKSKESLEDFENNNNNSNNEGENKITGEENEAEASLLITEKVEKTESGEHESKSPGKCETNQYTTTSNIDSAAEMAVNDSTTVSPNNVGDLGEAQLCQIKQEESSAAEDIDVDPTLGKGSGEIHGSSSTAIMDDGTSPSTEERQDEPEPETVDSRRIVHHHQSNNEDDGNTVQEGNGNDVVMMRGDDDDGVHNQERNETISSSSNNTTSTIHHVISANRIVVPVSSNTTSVVKNNISCSESGDTDFGTQITSSNRPVSKMTIGGDTSVNVDDASAPGANLEGDEKSTEYQLRIHAADLQQQAQGGFDTESVSGDDGGGSGAIITTTSSASVTSTSSRHQQMISYQNSGSNNNNNNNSGATTPTSSGNGNHIKISKIVTSEAQLHQLQQHNSQSTSSSTSAIVTTSVPQQLQQQQSRGVIHYTHHMGANQEHNNKSKAPY